MIIILFGLPGAGKNFIAEIFRDNFGFHIYDADEALPHPAFRAIKENHMVSEATRRAFYKKLAMTAKRLEKKYGAIVIPRTFTHDRSRRYFKNLLPEAKFILIEARRGIRYQRIVNRSHHIDLEYAKKFDSIFERPNISHNVIKNDGQMVTTLRRRIAKFLKTQPEV